MDECTTLPKKAKAKAREVVPKEQIVQFGWYSVSSTINDEDNAQFLCRVNSVRKTELKLALFEVDRKGKLSFVKYLNRKFEQLEKLPMRTITARERRLTNAFERTMKD